MNDRIKTVAAAVLESETSLSDCFFKGGTPSAFKAPDALKDIKGAHEAALKSMDAAAVGNDSDSFIKDNIKGALLTRLCRDFDMTGRNPHMRKLADFAAFVRNSSSRVKGAYGG